MKRTSLFTYALLLSLMVVFNACKSEEDLSGGTPPPTPDPENPENTAWNKNNTFDLYYITSLSDNNVNKDIKNVIEFINNKGKALSLAVVEGTDVTSFADRTACYNPVTEISFNTSRFCTFAMQGYNGSDIKGSTIVLSHKINQYETPKITNDCFFHFQKVQAAAIEGTKKIEVPFANVRFSTKEQIAAAGDTFLKYNQNAYKAVVFGTVKTSLLPDLEEKIKVSPSLRLSKLIGDDSEYTIFMVSRTTWIVREATYEEIGSARAIRLSVEAK